MVIKLIKGDCLEEMKHLKSRSIDLILADPPYGLTSCDWDVRLDLDLMWEQLNRLVKPRGAIVLTSTQPFTTHLIMSNLEMFKYTWVWEKSRPSGYIMSKNKPMKKHEDVCVFSKGVTIHKGQSKKRMFYYPQGLKKISKVFSRPSRESRGSKISAGLRPSTKTTFTTKFENYPHTVLKIPSEHNVKAYHPTQKPVALMEYMIKTYTRKGQLILDFTMGGGTTGIACKNTERNFIGIEKDPQIFKTAQKRISLHKP